MEQAPRPLFTAPPTFRTGFTSPKCYAAALNDCDGGPTTREHYISESLLRRFGDRFTMVGLPWASGPRTMVPNNLAARVLCERHNNQLGGLDSTIADLFDAILAFHRGAKVERDFNGEDLERWSLKVLCGIVASGNAGRHDRVRVRGAPPLGFLNVLFGHAAMPAGWGFHFVEPLPQEASLLQWTCNAYPPSDHRAGLIFGGTVVLLGFAYTTAMVRMDGDGAERRWYRPAAFDLNGRGAIRLHWSGESSSAVVVLRSSSTR